MEQLVKQNLNRLVEEIYLVQFSVLNRLFEVTDEKWRVEIDSLLFVLMQFILRENCYAWS